MGNNLLSAIALMLILEGCIPFTAPTLWREIFRHLTAMRDGQIRYIGLSSILAGLALLALITLWN
ncbi:MAG: DUF2065 domain-containing protein [Azoarcus sp.]|jgi:uncharacterized protein YjeT (DUF2065 family)|nr:DUF2065 domain-containing protein [Azoarcus sp.]